MKSGPRDQLVWFTQGTGGAKDGFGHKTLTWGRISDDGEYAAVFYGSGSEQRQAAQEGASQSASFEVLANPVTLALTPANKVESPATVYWDITGVHPLGRAGVRITATRKA